MMATRICVFLAFSASVRSAAFVSSATAEASRVALTMASELAAVTFVRLSSIFCSGPVSKMFSMPTLISGLTVTFVLLALLLPLLLLEPPKMELMTLPMKAQPSYTRARLR